MGELGGRSAASPLGSCTGRRGFSGTPFNLLVALDTKGEFIDVQVLSHHEPVFLDGLGEAPLMRFADQYAGLSLTQNIKIGSNANRGEERGSANVYIDGVAKATASVRILNQSLLSSALRVARERLGFAAGQEPGLVAHVRRDTYSPLAWDALLQAGLVQHVRITQGMVEKAFGGSGVELLVAGHETTPSPTCTPARAPEWTDAHSMSLRTSSASTCRSCPQRSTVSRKAMRPIRCARCSRHTGFGMR